MPKKEVQFKDTSTQQTLRALMITGMKSIYLRDVSGRIEVVYEAPIDATINDPCLRTTLKYLDGAGGTSRSVVAQEEVIVAWPGYEILQAGAGDDITLVP